MAGCHGGADARRAAVLWALEKGTASARGWRAPEPSPFTCAHSSAQSYPKVAAHGSTSIRPRAQREAQSVLEMSLFQFTVVR